MSWNPWRAPIDYALINNIKTPGILRIRNAGSPRAWDERNGYGWSGSFPVFMGVRLSHFDLGFECYTDDDLAQWYALAPHLAKPPYGKRPKALTIHHPRLRALEIGSIQVVDLKDWEFDDSGFFTIPVEVISFRVPKLALSKPEGADNNRDALDPYDQKIEALSAENAKKFDALTQQLAGQ